MTAKLRFKTKGVEIEWEGEVEFRHREGAPATKIPWGVDSGRLWTQTEVAKPLNLEATDVT